MALSVAEKAILIWLVQRPSSSMSLREDRPASTNCFDSTKLERGENFALLREESYISQAGRFVTLSILRAKNWVRVSIKLSCQARSERDSTDSFPHWIPCRRKAWP